MNSYVVNLYPVSNDQAPMQTLTVGAAPFVTTFVNNFDTKTNVFFFTLHNGNVYVTFDGSTPSATNGHTLEAPYSGWFNKIAIKNMKLIKHTGGAAIVAISQFTH